MTLQRTIVRELGRWPSVRPLCWPCAGLVLAAAEMAAARSARALQRGPVMDRKALHLEIRNALGLSDELGRYEHAFGNDEVAALLASLRTVLADVERTIGRPRVVALEHPLAARTLARVKAALHARRGEIPQEVHPRLDALLASIDRITFAVEHPFASVPAKPLRPLRTSLPLSRVVPQDVHSVVDWLAGLVCVGGAVFARTPAARAAGLSLGAASASLALLTDERLSPVRRVRIETHEALDYVWGTAAIAAPFVLGYGFRKRDRLATALSVAAGLVSVLAALVTDYRAVSGISSPMRSRGGPRSDGASKNAHMAPVG